MHTASLVDISDTITDLIIDRTRAPATRTRYRAPLVGFAPADDPRFDELCALVPDHLHPRELLPDARVVCAFYLPFSSHTVTANACEERVSEHWARAYVETNALLSELCITLVAELERIGIPAAWAPPTHNFDPVRLVSAWSHKSIGVICGLGQLGHHHMLITESGCAGRLGSIVLGTGTKLPPRRNADGSFCAFDRGCRVCIQRCPVGALTESGLDRSRCYARCLENDARFPQWTADVCGRCATGPCALQPMHHSKSSGEIPVV